MQAGIDGAPNCRIIEFSSYVIGTRIVVAADRLVVSDGDVFGKPTQRLINSPRDGRNKYLSMKPSSNFSTNQRTLRLQVSGIPWKEDLDHCLGEHS